MKRMRGKATYANVISTLALFLVLTGGAAYAATQLAKNSVGTKQLKKNSVTAAKIKKNAVTTAKIKANAVTGNQVNESTLATVPSAQSAVNAKNANALGNTPPRGFGQGIIDGGIDSAPNGGSFRTPFGVTTKLAAGAGLEAIAPVAIKLRDFEARWITNFDSDDTLAFAVQINNGSSLVSVPLCTIVGTAARLDCRAAGPIPIAQGDLYKLELTGTGLEENEQASFAYRTPAG